ncbi:hypothetical protein [Streptomyces bacillaris]|uniref:hypothetical protein n=1 Tax=Streptomyces bacillaris TaxID=68179 RepID=UPI00380D6D2B
MSDIVEYHWVLTLQGTCGPEHCEHRAPTISGNGLYNVRPGDTRKEIYDELVASLQSDQLAATGELLHNPQTITFVLQPNQL